MTELTHDIVIVGGGTGGISVAARLLNAEPHLDVAIIEPADTHYYQPLWTLVGGGEYNKHDTGRPMADVMPKGATWIKNAVETFDPDNNALTIGGGQVVRYKNLVVAPGIQIDWDKIKGAKEALGKDGVSSNYSFAHADRTWDFIKALKKGTAVFTFPPMPIKCAGAPQKIMWLAEHHFRRSGVRQDVNVVFASNGERIFGVEKYRLALEKLVEERGVDTRYQRNLIEVRADKKEAVFQIVGTDETEVIAYDFLHISPPQSAPDFIKQSPLANEAGFVDVDKHTLQHVRYPNVFSLGDASSLPTSKTGAAIRKEAPVLVENLFAARQGTALKGHYDGYTSCPLVTGYGRLILAEFDYDGNPAESFPFDQAEERYSMYALKKYGLPTMYWNGMMRGHA